MQFPREFFEDEVRDGFYVNGLMKRAWAAQLEVLEEVAKVCARHGIRWYADCGTLLGAVRHGGYIPWDDDLDICMMRDDYERFNRIARQELPEGYRILDYQTEEEYWGLLLRVLNSGEIRTDDAYLEKYHGFPVAAGIDIFPLDFAAPDPVEEEARSALADIALTVADRKDLEDECPSEETLGLIREVEESCRVTLDRSKPLKLQLYDLAVQMFSLYTRQEAKEVLLMPYWIDRHDHKYPLEYFQETVQLPFEMTTITAPAAYDAVLRIEYGDRYMYASRTGGVHDYPWFQKNVNLWFKLLRDPSVYRYEFDPKDLEAPQRMARHGLREQAEESIGLMGQIHLQLVKCLNADYMEPAAQLLERCQDSAIRTGTMLEENQGEGMPTVKLLEEYCELIYQIHELVLQGNRINGDEVYQILKEQLERVSGSLERDVKLRREVVFLPFKASLWNSFDSVWRAVREEPDCDVYVIPIPYYDRRYNGTYGELHYEGDQFPEDVPIVDYREYDFTNRHPDVIYIHNPYDQCNFATVLPPFFYSKNIRLYTDKLVYIPYFVTDDFDGGDQRAVQSMAYFVTVPGVIYADEVIVQSGRMRQNYVDALTKLCGADTREIWEKKILGLGSPLWDAPAGKGKKTEVPVQWQRLMTREDGSRKKVVLYYTDVSGLIQYGERMLQKHQEVLATFREHQEEILLLWHPQSLIKASLFSARPKLWRAYQRLVEQYREEGWGVYDDSDDQERAIAISDAYYGAPGSMVLRCQNAGIPVMLQEV